MKSSFKKARKVLVCGAYGYGNPGDEACLYIITNYLKEHGFEVWVNSFNPKFTEDKYKVKAIHTDLARDFWKKLKILLEIDLIIYGGGTQIADIKHTLYRMLILNMITKMRRKRVIYLGVGASLIQSKNLTKLVLKFADLITVRDAKSKRILIDLGYPNRIHVIPDPVFILIQSSERRISDILKQEGVDTNKKWVGVCIRIPKKHGDSMKDIAKICDYIVDEKKMNILFFPWQKKAYTRENTIKWFYFDDEVSLDIQKLMQNKHKSIVLEEDYSPSELLGIIGHMEMLIAAPFHSLVMGAKQCIPLIGIEYAEANWKVSELFNNLGLIDYLFVGYEDITYEKLKKRIDRLLSEKDLVIKQININVENLTKKASLNFDLL